MFYLKSFQTGEQIMKFKKAAISSGKSKTGERVSTKAVENTVTPEERQRMIAEAAYFRAEHRAFLGGSLEQDWLESEVEIDKILAA
jgi:hypothetical protein